MTSLEIEAVRQYAIQAFRCGKISIHGPGHWQKVENHGLLIARESRADVEVVRLFAVLHDCCRVDDGGDPEHGPRAAQMVQELAGSLIRLDPVRLEALIHAIRHHTGGQISQDPTIGTCWDADRLDLGRAGIIPSPAKMSTAPGRKIAELGSVGLYLEQRG